MGHLLGIIFEHFGFALDLLLTMPVLLTAYMPKPVFGPLMEVNPFYGVYKIVENMMFETSLSITRIMICLVTIPVCYIIIYIYMNTREPMKLSKWQ